MKNKIIYFFLILCLSIPFVFVNKKVEVSFQNYSVFIDAGHGGKDNGTSYNEVLEDEINLNISKCLYEMLLDDEFTTYLSRTSDYDLSSLYSKNHKVEDLNNRIKYIDSLNVDLFVSIHLNYYPNCNVSGIQVFHQKNERSIALANVLQKNLNTLNKKEKKCKFGDYYLLNNTSSIGVIIECGFLSNENDRNNLLKDSYIKKLSKIIKNSIIEYLK